MIAGRRATVVIVGASLAGLRAAEALRLEGFDGKLVLVGDEEHLPYNRPPLSKAVLTGEADHASIVLETVAELDCDWRLGSAAVDLDLAGRRVRLANGGVVGFDGLVIATGVRARPWGGGGDTPPDGVFTVRTLDDGLRLRAALSAARHAIVIGAGFIGCEVAASARALGIETTIVDRSPAPMLKHVGSVVGRWVRDLHERHGVELILDSAVAAFEGGERLTGVRLADGRLVEGDVAVVGLGTVPNTEWLARSGVPLDDGVVCDGALAVAGVPGVVAAGDVVRWPHPLVGRPIRVEHWSNAVEQSAWAARTLLHGGALGGVFDALPSFWSDQYGLRIQAAGFPAFAETGVVVEGSPEEDGFALLYGRGGRVSGALSVGLSPKRWALLRRSVLRRVPLDGVAA